jgi:hypothetical protein
VDNVDSGVGCSTGPLGYIGWPVGHHYAGVTYILHIAISLVMIPVMETFEHQGDSEEENYGYVVFKGNIHVSAGKKGWF